MALTIGEAHDLVLDRRAISRAAAFDIARKDWRLPDIAADHRMRRLGRLRDVASDLRVHRACEFDAEHLRGRYRRPWASKAFDSRWCAHRAAAACPSSSGRAAIRASRIARQARRDGASPMRPAEIFTGPIWMRPRRKVPVVTTTAPQASRRPSAVSTARTRPSAISRSTASPCAQRFSPLHLAQQALDRASIERPGRIAPADP